MKAIAFWTDAIASLGKSLIKIESYSG